jgi:hypothetical protein
MARSKAKGRAAPKRANAPKARRKTAKPSTRTPQPRTKAEACLALLMRPEGATLEELQKLTGWLPHSVRGFLAGTVKKMPGLALSSEKQQGQSRRYRVSRAPP